MKQTTLGDFKVSMLGLGTSRLASLGAHGSIRSAARLLDTAADLGVSFIDTADTYGSTKCERWLGKLLQTRSDRFVLSTKCGLPAVDLPRPLRGLNQPAKKFVQRFGQQHCIAPAYVNQAIEASLKRLRRERIEIYFIHEPPAGVETREELFATLEQAMRAGKIGSYGICSSNPSIIRASLAENRCRIVQTAADPLVTGTLTEAIRCGAPGRNIEIVANNVLARYIGDAATAMADTSFEATLLARKIEARCAERGVSRTHLLLRHAAALANVRVVLTGTGSTAHLSENAAALDEPLTAEDVLT
jgi:aryl-alcohol dehydrogenase-like predicted oxidoreductase